MTAYKYKTNTPGGIKEMLVIAFPMVIAHACSTVMTFTDRLFLSKLGTDHMNAAFAGGLTAMLFMTFFIGLIGYSTAVVAQYFGAGEKTKAAGASVQAVLIVLIAFPLMLLLKPVGELIFSVSGVPGEQLELQKIYFSILINGSIFVLLRNAYNGFYTGIGRTKVVMVASLVAMTVNVAANYVLIFGKFGLPALGVRGAAYGTIIGEFTSGAVMLVLLFARGYSKKYNFKVAFRFSREIMQKLLKYGYPAGVEFLMNFLAFTLLIMIFQAHSPETGTATTILFNWDMVAFVPLIGIEVGVTSLVGRYLGRKEKDTAEKAAYSGVKAGIIYSAIVFVAFLGFSEALTRVFSPSVYDPVFEAAVPLSKFMIRFAAPYVLLEAFLVAVIGTLRGAGDTRLPMIMSVSVHYLFLLAAWLILHVFDLSPEIAWVTIVVIFLVFCFLFMARFKSGKWKEINMIEK